MPNKYSHSVVLAHYSSVGLIDLPNDQYIAYLKTYPSSRRPSTSSSWRGHSSSRHDSVTPSGGYNTKYIHLNEHGPSSRYVTSRREYATPTRRNIIVESDEGSGDEQVILHPKYEPIDPEPPFQKEIEGRGGQRLKKKLPSVSTYTGRSSSEASERMPPSDAQQQAPPQVKKELKTSPSSIINLNEFEAVTAAPGEHTTAEPVQSAAPAVPSLKSEHISAQTKSVNGRTPSSLTLATQIYSPTSNEKLGFDGFSQQQISEVTITGPKNADASLAPVIATSQFSNPSPSTQPLSSPSAVPASLPERMDSAASFNRDSSKTKPPQPRHNRSYDSISSINSEDMMHLTTALPPVVPHKQQKPLRSKPGKISLTSRDAKVNDEAIDPSFFETLRGGPKAVFVTPKRERPVVLRPNSPASDDGRTSLQYSRTSADHAPANTDFWRGLEEMLSDSDASVVFPPDIAKYKPRNGNDAPTAKVDKTLRNGTENGEPKRPTTAPGPTTTSRDMLSSQEPIPEGRSKITVTNGNVEKSKRDTRELTTIQLVDTSAEKQGKHRFLRKLRKKSYNERKP
jgi:hypothetical protein